jgi:subtilisin family serine protease
VVDTLTHTRAFRTILEISVLLLPLTRGASAEYTALQPLVLADSPRVDLRLRRFLAMSRRGAAPRALLPAPDGLAAGFEPRLRVWAQLDHPGGVAQLAIAGHAPLARVGRVVSLELTASGIAAVAAVPAVLRVEPVPRRRMSLDVNTIASGALRARSTFGVGGAGVLVGVIDSGIDWRHPDFLRADGSTRVHALWDQLDDSFQASGGAVGSAPPLRTFGGAPVGTVYRASQLDAALQGRGIVNSMDLLGHGTLVAACAAANDRRTGYSGVAPEANVVVVRAGGESKTDDGINGDTLAALQWIGEVAAEARQPVAVNLSFGHHFGAHDGSSAEEVAIDEFTALPGRVVTVSAGNEHSAGLHTSGSARGSRALQVDVGPATADLVAVDCWFGGNDVVDLGFFDPRGSGVANADVLPGQCREIESAVHRVSLCVDDVNPVNGAREVTFLAEPRVPGGSIANGTWQFILRDEGGVGSGRYDCWSVNFQPFSADVDPSSTVAIPGTARDAVTVGAANLRASWPSQRGPDTQIGLPVVDDIAFFSSIGPTRDGRLKPDLVAGGHWVVGAWSIADGTGSGIAGSPTDPRRVTPDAMHVAGRGTSFAAPQAAGAAALLLELNGQLTGRMVAAALRASAARDRFTGSTPNTTWGQGKLEVEAALRTVMRGCVADCDGDGSVRVDEIIIAVQVALGESDLALCPAADASDDGLVTVDELQLGVEAALQGCLG